jgi:hypothetical protein
MNLNLFWRDMKEYLCLFVLSTSLDLRECNSCLVCSCGLCFCWQNLCRACGICGWCLFGKARDAMRAQRARRSQQSRDNIQRAAPRRIFIANALVLCLLSNADAQYSNSSCLLEKSFRPKYLGMFIFISQVYKTRVGGVRKYIKNGWAGDAVLGPSPLFP